MFKIQMRRCTITNRFESVERVRVNYAEHAVDVIGYTCAGSTTKIFKLPPGAPECVVTFTKKKPANDLPVRKITYRGQISPFRGNLMHTTIMILINMYERGYRYVQIHPPKGKKL